MGIDSDFFNKDGSPEGELSEDSLRLALERLGGKNHRRPTPTNHQKAHPDQKRRRFVQEGQVVVEHHQLSRASLRAAPIISDDHAEEVSRLRNLLKVEQRRAEDAQRDLNDVQVQLRTLETHLVHEKLHATEIKKKYAEVERSLLEAQGVISRLREEAELRKPKVELESGEPTPERKTRGRGRPPRVREETVTSGEPEPVRWWKE